MSPQLETIEKDALLLSRDEKEHLGAKLLQSLRDEGVDPAWLADAERRFLEVKRGQGSTLSEYEAALAPVPDAEPDPWDAWTISRGGETLEGS